MAWIKSWPKMAEAARTVSTLWLTTSGFDNGFSVWSDFTLIERNEELPAGQLICRGSLSTWQASGPCFAMYSVESQASLVHDVMSSRPPSKYPWSPRDAAEHVQKKKPGACPEFMTSGTSQRNTHLRFVHQHRGYCGDDRVEQVAQVLLRQAQRVHLEGAVLDLEGLYPLLAKVLGDDLGELL